MIGIKDEISGDADMLMNICSDVGSNIDFDRWDLPEEKILYWIEKKVFALLTVQRKWDNDVAKDFINRHMDYVVVFMRMKMKKQQQQAETVAEIAV